MTSKPVVLDLFCGAGGAGMGYYQAGYSVVGVDIVAQKHYPFPFVQMDALDYLFQLQNDIKRSYTLIHASPPCQSYSILSYLHPNNTHPRLIDRLRELLDGTHLPYVIENVRVAPLKTPICLCGTQFGLKLFRHRYFEIGMGGEQFMLLTPLHIGHKQLGLSAPHTSRAPDYEKGEVHSVYGHFSGVKQVREAMQIGWMTRNELAQAIPPAYTRYIGAQILESSMVTQ